MNTEIEALNQLLAVLDRLELKYLIGGSVASSFHGHRRFTYDVDLVVALLLPDIDEFAVELQQAGFYAEPAQMRDAIRYRRAFNVIHQRTAYKFDMFPQQHDAFSRTQFGRRKYETLDFEDSSIECAIASAEDTLLNKLRWYREGNETSETQWNDVRGIVQVSGPQLDFAYLQEWAPKLNVADLLERLLAESKN